MSKIWYQIVPSEPGIISTINIFYCIGSFLSTHANSFSVIGMKLEAFMVCRVAVTIKYEW